MFFTLFLKDVSTYKVMIFWSQVTYMLWLFWSSIFLI